MKAIKFCLVMMAVALLTVGTIRIAAADDAPTPEETKFNYSGWFEADGISRALNSEWVCGAPPAGLPTMGTVLNFRGDFRMIFSENVTAKWRVGYLADSVNNAPGSFTLSRGYIDLTKNRFGLRVGKQRLAWGTGYAWNPTNMLDAPRNPFDNADDPEGKFGIRADYNFGPFTGQFFVTPDCDYDHSGRALRLKLSPGGCDITLDYLEPGSAPKAVGGDFAFSVSGIGVHGEILYQAEGNRRADKKDVLNYLAGVDYTLSGGVNLNLEYYYNDQGFTDSNDFANYIAARGGVNPIEVITSWMQQGGALREHYFLRAGKSGLFQNINSEVMLIYAPTDGSLVAQPKLEYEFDQNTLLFLKGNLPIGTGAVEANLLPVRNVVYFGVKVNF